MRLLLVVQRYGEDVLGGAEQLARSMAVQLSGAGHQVDVVTSCARSYVSWANVYPSGSALVEGVRVHRLPAQMERRQPHFAHFERRVLGQLGRAPYHLQREWMRLQGPCLPELPDWIASRSGAFDVAIFFTYLYYTTWAGMAAARCPVLMHPTAHDEAPIHLSLFDSLFGLPDGYAFLTPEEADFVGRRFRIEAPCAVTGTGIELGRPTDQAAFRREFGLGERQYLACVGRIDEHKGSIELAERFIRYKSSHPQAELALVYIGDGDAPLPAHPDLIRTGYLSERLRDSGVAGATALVQPSAFESFSIVLCEAWAAGVPALVQRRSDVLAGQVRRSGGGLAYSDQDEFESQLALLISDAGARRRMGEAGRGYVEANYSWPVVLGKYQALLESVAAG